MHFVRSLKLGFVIGGVFLAPVFVFAQTASDTATSTPPQPTATTTTTVVATTTKKTAAEIVSSIQNSIFDKIRSQLQQLTETTLSSMTSESTPASNDLDIKTSPQNPGPYQQITVTIESYSTDLDKASIRWTLNGKIASNGTGQRKFSFQNGAGGETTRLNISIYTNSGQSITRTLSWRPLGVTTLWQATTYTPPFYRGKALLAPGARVKVVALPDNNSKGNALSAGNLAYVWKMDGTTVEGVSGYGKNSFTFWGPKPLENKKVSVLASTVDDSAKTESRISLTLSQPMILFYESDPLLGILYNHALSSDYNLSKKELSLSAEPYYFSNEESEDQILDYNWSLNGTGINNNKHTITLRNDTGSSGDSIVSLAMSNIQETYQKATQTLLLHFGGGESSTNAPLF